jgi:predicted ATPase/class 3 adenylate cyclase/DNA-binding XRE family transcriptional regulator
MPMERRSRSEEPTLAVRPSWNRTLRALREARGVAQATWADLLGRGRSTVQRWERGEAVPDPEAEAEIVAYCREHALFRAFDHGPLQGVLLTPELLRDLLAEARISLSGGLQPPERAAGADTLAPGSSRPERAPAVPEAGAATSVAPQPARPTGTVTFLFTDIEGSTARWDQHPDTMRVALARHDTVLRAILESHRGSVFKTVGDAFCAAFAAPIDAVLAALAIQQALSNEDWGEVGPLRVRIALHVGVAEEREGDYFGPPLNRVARLLSAGHGGQVLVSLPVEQLVRDELPPSVELRNLGEHHLRDLARPEQVFQLVHPALQTSFPPLRSKTRRRTNLTEPLTSFVGRTREIAEVNNLLAGARLLTLTGVGGVGKTRLALAVGAAALDGYADGVWLVELAALTDPANVRQAIAATLSVQEEAGRTLADSLTAFLETKRLVLILDNCEHLIAACALVVEQIMRACPGIHVLATSREALGVPGETVYAVPPLAVPPLQAPASVDEVTPYEAVQLFVARAAAVLPRFAITEQTVRPVAQICARLDGIPLALELAAARVRVLSVEQIAARLDDCFHLLTGGSRTVLPRQQTLQAAITWSHDLLSDDEQRLFRRLAVFAGGFTLEAAEAVCGARQQATGHRQQGEDDATVACGLLPVAATDVLDLLTRLVDKSMVMVEEVDTEARYRLLETVRRYALDKLEAADEVVALRGRHTLWCVDLAERAEPELRGAHQGLWLERLEREHENLRAALAWSIEAGQGAPLGRLAGALGEFWLVRGHLDEGRRWLEHALAHGGGISATLRTKVLIAAGALAHRQGDDTRAATLHEECLALHRELGDMLGSGLALIQLGNVARSRGEYARATMLYEEALGMFRDLNDRRRVTMALNSLGLVAGYQGDYARAATLYTEALAIRRELGDHRGVAVALNNLGLLAARQGDYDQAEAFHTESLAIRRGLGDKHGVAVSLGNLGEIARGTGASARAMTLYQEAMTLFQELGDQLGVAVALTNLGSVACRMGDYWQAQRWFRDALILRRDLGDTQGVATCLEGLAGLLCDQGSVEQAVCLLGAAEGLRDAIGAPLPPAERLQYDQIVATARTRMDEHTFRTAWAAGRMLTMNDAITRALDGP